MAKVLQKFKLEQIVVNYRSMGTFIPCIFRMILGLFRKCMEISKLFFHYFIIFE